MIADQNILQFLNQNKEKTFSGLTQLSNRLNSREFLRGQ